MPVKVHLENPFLGKTCFVGSSTSPIIWNLTTGTTNPPAPNNQITGTAGKIEFLEEGRILEAKGAKLVDNAWSAPEAIGLRGDPRLPRQPDHQHASWGPPRPATTRRS